MGILQYPLTTTGFHGAKIIKSTAQTIVGSLGTVINFDSIYYDPDVMWSGALNSRLFIRIAGYYRVSAAWQFINATNAASAVQYGYIAKNGNSGDLLAISAVVPWDLSGAYGNINHCNGEAHLEVNDYMELVVYHNCATSKNILTSYEFSPTLTAELIS